MKSDYLLIVSDNTTKKINKFTTNKIEVISIFENVTYRDALYKAEKYLIENKTLLKNFNSTYDINLYTRRFGIPLQQQMIRIKPNCLNGDGLFEGWKGIKNGKLIELEPKTMVKMLFVSRLALIFFTLYSIASFIMSLLLIKNVFMMQPDILNQSKVALGFLNVLIGLILSGIISPIREEYNRNAESENDIIFNNMKFELPFFLATSSTIINFFNEDLTKGLFIFQVIIIVVAAIGILFKAFFDIESDLNKFHIKRTKKLSKVL